MGEHSFIYLEWAILGSNQGPLTYQVSALTTELIAQISPTLKVPLSGKHSASELRAQTLNNLPQISLENNLQELTTND